uniref:Uncharacterized protein n=1 Tax=Arundo donax TaxID=35708 RepID=A0A0A8YUQ1_ARUDO
MTLSIIDLALAALLRHAISSRCVTQSYSSAEPKLRALATTTSDIGWLC